MGSPIEDYGGAYFQRRLSSLEVQTLTAYLASRANTSYLGTPRLVKPVPERRFRLNRTPQEPIFKLAKREHVESFFDTGILQLGCFRSFQNFDHPEIGDATEGLVTLVAKFPKGVIGGTYRCGLDRLVFCTVIGELDQGLMAKFGYDWGYQIKYPKKFLNCIREQLNAKSASFGRCVYRDVKAVLGYPGNKVNLTRFDHNSPEIVNSAKHLIKPSRFSHQREFRFLWGMHQQQNGPVLITCKEATKYCVPIRRIVLR